MKTPIITPQSRRPRTIRSFVSLLMILSLLLTLTLSFSGCGTPSSDSENTTPDTPSADLPADGKPADPPKKRVAITFDDGPHNIWTKQIVNELGRYAYRSSCLSYGYA